VRPQIKSDILFSRAVSSTQPRFFMSTLKVLSFEDVVAKFREPAHKVRESYRVMYSTWYGGLITDPQLMMVPIDDHVVHRGDGVFEAAKCTGHGIFAMRRHLERLFLSAGKIGLSSPHSLEELEGIAVEAVRLSGLGDAMIRLYLSRGPGGFTANPYESIGNQIYLVVTRLNPVAPEKYESGVRVRISSHAIKEGFWSTVKSCNYLPNVMMKKESVDAGVDFTVSRDESGYLAESSTENFGIVSKDDELLIPAFSKTLRGVTAVRVMELAEDLVKSGRLKSVRNAHITQADVASAKEAMMLGTTLDCLPVTSFEDRPVADGQVGPICRTLLGLLREDMKSGPLVTWVR
jgi:4-amino-4-deoxychorismate lyase